MITSYYGNLGSFFHRSIYRSIGTLLKEEQAKEGKLEVQKYRGKPRVTNLLFFCGFHARFSIAAPQIPAHAPGRLRRQPPRTPATQQHCPMPEKEDVLEEGEAGN